MSNHNELQKEHYARQYSTQELSLEYQPGDDLWDWAKWYPLLVFQGFLRTIPGKSVVVTCCGAGRELGLMQKCGVRITATDLTVDHLRPMLQHGIVERTEVQNAERLTYPDESFDYGFVNAGLHHLSHPHAGLCELMRASREAAIFIESQDSVLHAITRKLGRGYADFEPAGNYVYRWKRREVEKIALSAHAHSYAIKTAFLPILVAMRGVTGWKKEAARKFLLASNSLLAPIGNLFICMIFKRQPSAEQLSYLKTNSYLYRPLTYLDRKL